MLSEKKEASPKKREEPSSYFQRQRVDDLLADLATKFPPKVFHPPAAAAASSESKIAKTEGV